ncbi:MAG: N-acetyltransferase [Lachnospiraceae bacterium]|nr:N-acetyltransferase [Lachnospiraceae bacterium]
MANQPRIAKQPRIGKNVIIGENVILGENVVIQNNCIIEDNVVLGDNSYIDNNCLIRNDVVLGENSTIGANCILGEYQMDFFKDHEYHKHELIIGKNAIIRSGCILYSGTVIGDNFQAGHQVTIRENSQIGNSVSAGTLTDIQGHCKIGNYVRMHSSVHVGTSSVIDDCCWIYPYVVFTNDPTPPSDTEIGVHVHAFAIVATNAIILPGIDVQSDSLIGAGTIVNRNVEKYQVVVGNPGKPRADIRDIKNRETGEPYYPWRYHFDRNMPWKNYGFDNWYATLDDDMKQMLIGK